MGTLSNAGRFHRMQEVHVSFRLEAQADKDERNVIARGRWRHQDRPEFYPR